VYIISATINIFIFDVNFVNIELKRGWVFENC